MEEDSALTPANEANLVDIDAATSQNLSKHSEKLELTMDVSLIDLQNASCDILPLVQSTPPKDPQESVEAAKSASPEDSFEKHEKELAALEQPMEVAASPVLQSSQGQADSE